MLYEVITPGCVDGHDRIFAHGRRQRKRGELGPVLAYPHGPDMRPTPGSRLGPYEVVAPLGAGGMGEVYRARDTRLGREVAIKVLPAEVAKDAERLHRFEQEAKAVSALNHPHIVTLYEVGESDFA